jgi:predicted amidohydrolase YtcJ
VSNGPSADVVFVGGRIMTLHPAQQAAEAVAVTCGWISAVGTASDVLALRGPRTEVVDLSGRTLVPGFYDAHQHQADAGLLRHHVDGRASSVGELVERVRTAARGRSPGDWIEGFGWEERSMAEGRPPTAAELDEAAPDNPVAIARTCGHALATNGRALALAGIDAATSDPAGGRIDRDAAGRPTGVLHEHAMEAVRRLIPLPSDDDIEAAILAEAQGNLALGVTSVWEPWAEPRLVEIYRRLDREGRLPIRVTMAQAGFLRSGEAVPLPREERGERLSLTAVKLLQDGAIAPRTAALKSPYEDEPGNRGLLLWQQPELEGIVAKIHRHGLQVSIHAIGDAAIESALTAIERAQSAWPRPDPRHRIEHCGLPLGDLPARVARAGIVAVLQPPFVRFHGETYARNLGAERAQRLYPARSLLAAGAVVAGSSDSPVVPDRSPLTGVQTAMTRRTVDGTELAPGEAITLEQALRLYTFNAAYAAGEEGRKGSIAAGKAADLVVLGADLGDIAADEFHLVPVEGVWLDGALVRPDPLCAM